MGKSISFFNPYSQGENQVTNYCGLMLKMLYKESPEAFEKTINDLISDSRETFSCLPDFKQQVKKTNSIPDLCFSQQAFEIYFETKKTDWFYNNQIERHIDGFENNNKATKRILFLLTNEFNPDEERIKDGVDYALEKGVILQKLTFKDFLDTLKLLIKENEFELSKYFREYLNNLKKVKPVVVCGDLNVAHNEIDLKNDKTNHHNAGFTDEEREKMTLLLNSGFIDTFRYKYPLKETYSWWSYMFKAREKNAGWRIDYFLTSSDLKDYIKDAYIYTEIMGSDHCPVGLELEEL